MYRAGIIALTAMLLIAAAPTQSLPPLGDSEKAKTESSEQNSAADDHAAQNTMVIGNAENTEKAKQKAAKYTPKQPNDWFDGWSLSDKIAGIIGVVAFLQFLALAGTIWVMGGTAKRQLRAYIGVREIRLELEPLYGITRVARNINGVQVWTNFITVTLENFGPTPAREVTFVGYFSWVPFGQRLADDFNFYALNDWQTMMGTGNWISHFDLAPGQTEISRAPITDLNALTQAHQGRLHQMQIFVWGRVYYKDIYGRPWRVKFCRAWEPYHASGERYVAYSDHNGEDRESLEDQMP